MHSKRGAERPAPPRSRGVADFLHSFTYAWAGVVFTVRTQRNARVHLGIAAVVVVVALVLRVGRAELALLVAMMALVITLEMLNTVVEAVVDLVTDEYHPLARIAKDVAAGSVLVGALGAAVVGLLLLAPPLVALVTGR